jgi:hypothetical protein
MIVNFHIDRLVLDGVAERDGARVGEAVTAELTRLLGEDGAVQRFSRDRALPTVRAEAALPPASRADLLGVRIGRAVHRAIGE